MFCRDVGRAAVNNHPHIQLAINQVEEKHYKPIQSFKKL